MRNFRTIIEALLIFMSGVLFAYFTYPFFNDLLSVISAQSGIFEGWGTIQSLLWVGYFAVLALWILYFPASKILGTQEPN